jgi:hypothetical protein
MLLHYIQEKNFKEKCLQERYEFCEMKRSNLKNKFLKQEKTDIIVILFMHVCFCFFFFLFSF